MNIKGIISIVICFSIFNFRVNAQELILRKLTQDEKKNSVISAYEYNGTDHYGKIKLLLYKNGTFYYSLSSFNQDVFSEGAWVKKGDLLTLTNKIKNGNIPVELTYSDDSSNLINGFKIGIVKNLKGEEMPDGLIAINNDSVRCAPSYGLCRSKFNSIDSVKIVFENGLYSPFSVVFSLLATHSEYKNYRMLC